MKRKKMVNLNFSVNFMKYDLQAISCWPAIDRLISTLVKIHSSAHPSYIKILTQCISS